MKNSSGILKGILAFVVLVAIGITFGWLASRHKPTAPEPVASTTEPTKPTERRVGFTAQTVSTNEVPTEPTEAPSEPTDPADKISDILADDSEITNKVVSLLELYPKLSPAGKLECAEHLTNLVGDEPDEYAPMEKILLADDVPPKVASHLLGDLINRPPELMMPVYLKVVTNPNHPGNKEARETLETYVDEDFGDNAEKWTKAVNDWLKENTQTSAPAETPAQ